MVHCFTATLVSRGITLKDNESAILYTISRRIMLKVKEITALYTIHNCVWAALSTGTSEECLKLQSWNGCIHYHYTRGNYQLGYIFMGPSSFM